MQRTHRANKSVIFPFDFSSISIAFVYASTTQRPTFRIWLEFSSSLFTWTETEITYTPHWPSPAALARPAPQTDLSYPFALSIHAGLN